MYKYRRKIKFNKYEKAFRVLSALFKDRANVPVIIFPYGECGRLTKDILNKELDVREDYIVDYKSGDAGTVTFEDIDVEEFIKNHGIVLLSSDSRNYYVELRNLLEKFFPLENIIDVFSVSMYFDPGMYFEESCFDRADSAYSRVELLESLAKEIYRNGVKGSIAECGVYRGDFSSLINEIFPERELFLFDTFSGFDERDLTEEEMRASGEWVERTKKFINTTMEMVESKLPWKRKVRFKQGYFPDSALNDTEVLDRKFAFVSLDMDLYKPMKAALDFFWNRMAPGGYILVDEARCEGMPRVREALTEFCREHKTAYSLVSYKYGKYEFNNGAAVIARPLA